MCKASDCCCAPSNSPSTWCSVLHTQAAFKAFTGAGCRWRGAPEHARGALPCLETDPVAPLKTRVLWSWGNWGLGTCAADCIETVLFLSPWEWWLGQDREGTVGHREGPTGTHSGSYLRDTSLLSPCPMNLSTLLIPREKRAAFNPISGCQVLLVLARSNRALTAILRGKEVFRDTGKPSY